MLTNPAITSLLRGIELTRVLTLHATVADLTFLAAHESVPTRLSYRIKREIANRARGNASLSLSVEEAQIVRHIKLLEDLALFVEGEYQC